MGDFNDEHDEQAPDNLPTAYDPNEPFGFTDRPSWRPHDEATDAQDDDTVIFAQAFEVSLQVRAGDDTSKNPKDHSHAVLIVSLRLVDRRELDWWCPTAPAMNFLRKVGGPADLIQVRGAELAQAYANQEDAVRTAERKILDHLRHWHRIEYMGKRKTSNGMDAHTYNTRAIAHAADPMGLGKVEALQLEQTTGQKVIEATATERRNYGLAPRAKKVK